ncbi:hypothetical protein ZWY2020_016042 [Hordeum vulgare]|nr:hypothetical protein ZWY2020_016042 [Hordeum vulgare]
MVAPRPSRSSSACSPHHAAPRPQPELPRASLCAPGSSRRSPSSATPCQPRPGHPPLLPLAPSGARAYGHLQQRPTTARSSGRRGLPPAGRTPPSLSSSSSTLSPLVHLSPLSSL